MLAAADDGRPAPRSSLAQDMQNKRLQTLENRGPLELTSIGAQRMSTPRQPIETTEAFSRRLRTWTHHARHKPDDP
ncbi:hypothetical protein Landi51_02118 [Colletotrichum acutatum]